MTKFTTIEFYEPTTTTETSKKMKFLLKNLHIKGRQMRTRIVSTFSKLSVRRRFTLFSKVTPRAPETEECTVNHQGI